MDMKIMILIFIGGCCLLCCCLNKNKIQEAMNNVMGSSTQMDPNGPSVKVTNYYAPWCGHSRNLLPTWEEVENTYARHSRIQVDKIDCEKNPEAAKENEIRGFPTIILYKDNDKIVYQGKRDLESIKAFIGKHLE